MSGLMVVNPRNGNVNVYGRFKSESELRTKLATRKTGQNERPDKAVEQQQIQIKFDEFFKSGILREIAIPGVSKEELEPLGQKEEIDYVTYYELLMNLFDELEKNTPLNEESIVALFPNETRKAKRAIARIKDEDILENDDHGLLKLTEFGEYAKKQILRRSKTYD